MRRVSKSASSTVRSRVGVARDREGREMGTRREERSELNELSKG